MPAHGRYDADAIIRDAATDHARKAKELRDDAARLRAQANENDSLAAEHEAIAWDLSAVAEEAPAVISAVEVTGGGRPPHDEIRTELEKSRA